MTGTSIIVDHLAKSYGETRAVDDISFTVEGGEIFGVLGPNGAGKTTTIEIIEGLRRQDSGNVKVLGYDPRKELEEIKERIGVQLQSASFYPNLAVRELISLFGSFFRKAAPPDPLIEQLGLSEKRNTLNKDLSGGQRQRLSLALALVNDPELVFLDEPTTGLDPQARRSLWDIIQGLRDNGKTVLLTTHYMEEAERLCDRVAVMDHGKILVLDRPQELIRRYFKESAIEFETSLKEEAFKNLPSLTYLSVDGKTVTLYSSHVQDTLSALMVSANGQPDGLSDIRIRRASLEDVFLKLTGRRIRD